MLEHLAAPDEGLGFEIGEGDDFVDEAHVERFLGVVLTAEIPDLPGFLLADNAGEVAAAESAIEAADFRAGLAELGVVRRDGEIAHDMEHMPAADSVSGNHRNDGFWQRAELALDVEDVQARDAVFADVTGISTYLLIAAGAEGERSFSTKDDDTHVRIFMQDIERDEHLLHGLRTEGIAHFRPVDGELADAVFGFLKLDVFEGLDRGPHGKLAMVCAARVCGGWRWFLKQLQTMANHCKPLPTSVTPESLCTSAIQRGVRRYRPG